MEEVPTTEAIRAGYMGIHLAPATHRTVVTTTTTTIVSFPPVLIPRPPSPKLLPDHEGALGRAWGGRGRTARFGAPGHEVGEDGAVVLDPKLYPLAGARLPDDWRDRGFALPVGDSQLTTRFNPGTTLPTPVTATPGQSQNAVASGMPSTAAPPATDTELAPPPRKRARVETPQLSGESSTPVPHRSPSQPRNRLGSASQAPPDFLPSPLLSPSGHHHGSGNAFDSAFAAPASPADSRVSDDGKADDVQHPATSFGSGLELPALLSLPSMMKDFAALPPNLQQYALFQFLRLSSTPVLQYVLDLVTPALRRDFLADLPPEIAVLILTELDGRTLTRASRVSRTWHRLIDGEWRVWKGRMIQEGLWVGDGIEELDAIRVTREEAGDFDRRSDFVRRWEAGVWEEAGLDRRTRVLRGVDYAKKHDLWSELDPLLDRGIEPGPSRSGPRWKAGSGIVPKLEEDQDRSDVLLGKTKAPASPASEPDNSSRDIVTIDGLIRNGHFVNKYKLLYRKRSLMRRNWRYGEPKRTQFAGHGTNVVTCLQFDREKIISASDDHSINMFEMRSGRRIRSFDGHEGGVWALQYVGNQLVTGSTDRTVRVWDIATGKNTHSFLGHTSTVRCLQIVEPVNVNPRANEPPIWEPAYPLIVTGSRDHSLRIWRLPSIFDDTYRPNHVCIADENLTLADAKENPYHLHLLAGHAAAVRALSASGKLMVSGSYDNTVRVWDIVAGTCRHIMRGHEEKVYSVAIDAKRNRCASGSLDTHVRLWDIEHGTCLFVLKGHTSLVGLLGLSHHHVISAAADSTLRVWNPETGVCQNHLVAHAGAITCFRHDNYKIVSGSDGTMKMWDVNDGREIGRDLLTGLSGVWQVDFDERFCVAAVQRNQASEFEVLDFGAVHDHEDAEKGDDSASAKLSSVCVLLTDSLWPTQCPCDRSTARCIPGSFALPIPNRSGRKQRSKMRMSRGRTRKRMKRRKRSLRTRPRLPNLALRFRRMRIKMARKRRRS